jgi:hypothetical protein
MAVTGLDGVWEVERAGGLLPPLVGVRKRISGSRGQTVVRVPPGLPFDVVGRELHYRGLLSGLVDVLEPEGDGWRGVARYRGRELGRFAMSRINAARG